MALPNTAARQQFIEDELMRMPMVADQVFDATWRELQDTVPGLKPQERFAVAELLQAGMAQRARLAEAFVASVREQVLAQPAPSEGVNAHGPAPLSMLALLDETEVAADVEISRAIEAIKSTAEHELRELAAYTSALVGDMDVSRDHNPFRAELFAQALWDAARALNKPNAYHVMLMRHASAPLAQVLRKTYAGACARLEAMGLEPAAYRTLVIAAGPRVPARDEPPWHGRPPDLAHIRASMPASVGGDDASPSGHLPLDRLLDDAERALRALPDDAPATEHAQLMESQRAQLLRHARTTVDQQAIELLGRLFEAMLADKRMSRDIRAVLARLQPSMLRLVLRDETALEDYEHPAWHFMDLIAHFAALHADGSTGREEILRLADALVDDIASQRKPDAELFRRMTGQLCADDAARLKQRVGRAQIDIATLQAMEDRLQEAPFGVPTGVGPLDASQIDTVPADLMDTPREARNDAPEAAPWLDARHPGDWLRIFSHGRWIRAQVLWQGRHGDIWLFGQDQTPRTLAMRRRALERLHGERLLTPLSVRSMLRSAAVHLAQNPR